MRPDAPISGSRANAAPPSTQEPEQHAKQRQLADLIVRLAPMDDVRVCVAMGAKVDAPVTQGLRPLHYATYANNVDAVRYLLLRGCDVDAQDECGYTAIHLCAEHGNADLLRQLLLYSPRVCFRDRAQETADFPVAYKCDEPLRLAIKNDHYACAQLLLEHGADANAKYFAGPELALVPPADLHYIRAC